MREIKFKGFHECENGKKTAVVNGKEYRGQWVMGCLAINDCIEPNEYFIMPVVLCHKNENDNKYTIGGWYAIIPETVSQYTGLTGKNSVEIYCNDRVEFDDVGEDSYSYEYTS